MAESTSSCGVGSSTSDLTTDESRSDGPPPQKKRKSVSGVKFKPSWILPKFVSSSTKGARYAYCQLCAKHFTVSHGGINYIKRHVEGAVHQQKYKDSQSCASISSLFGGNQQQRLIHASNVLSAEIKMTQFIAVHNLPFQAADHLSDLFKSIFPDSAIASDFACKRTKTKAIICDALDPHMKTAVVDIVKSTAYSLLCDESNDSGDSVKLLTILVRFFDPVREIVVTRHLDTVGITDVSAEGIFTALAETVQKYNLQFSNLLSFASDTCNVMKGARCGVVAKLRGEQPKLLDIHCICHLVSLVVKSATKTLPLKIDELLVDIYYHFHYSVKRVTSLKEYADFCCTEYKSILKHVETRWLSLTRVIQRTLEMWDALGSYFASHSDVDKAGKVRNIHKLLSNPITKVWFCFLSNVLVVFNKFNIYFQTSKTSTIHKLHGESIRLLKTVLSFFLDPSIVRDHSGDLTRIQFTDTAIHLPHSDLFIGDSTSALLLHLDEEGVTTRTFYEGVVNFYIAAIKKLIKAFDFKSKNLQALSFLDPCNSQIITQSTFNLIEQNFSITFDKAAVKLEHREFVLDTDVKPDDYSDAVAFWVNIAHLRSPMGELKYANLALLALKLLSIPSSNADSERVFSLVRRIKTEFRSSLLTETLSALIGCHFNKTSSCCEMASIDESLISKAKTCTRERNLSYASNSSSAS